MSFLLGRFFVQYRYAMDELADNRNRDWYFMGTIWPTFVLTSSYLYFVMKIGPKWMENRKAFNVDRLMIAYNFVQVLFNAFVSLTIAKVVFTTFNYYCNPVDYSDDPNALTLLSAQWWYYIMKIVDLLDTLFFVLRKKENQITFLHVYHHWGMVWFSWILAKFYGGGHTMFISMINSFVHVCMYLYYMVTVWNKDLKNNLMLKRRITELQLSQFVIGLFVQAGPLIMTGCQYSKFLAVFTYPQDIFFMFLFGDFYIRTYLYPKISSVEDEKISRAK